MNKRRSAFRTPASAIYIFLNILQSKVFRSDRDLIGVLTFGTARKVPPSLDFNHLALTAALDRPSVENIFALERLLGEEGPAIFEKEAGSCSSSSGQGVAIHEVLWYSQSLFASVKEELSSFLYLKNLPRYRTYLRF